MIHNWFSGLVARALCSESEHFDTTAAAAATVVVVAEIQGFIIEFWNYNH